MIWFFFLSNIFLDCAFQKIKQFLALIFSRVYRVVYLTLLAELHYENSFWAWPIIFVVCGSMFFGQMVILGRALFTWGTHTQAQQSWVYCSERKSGTEIFVRSCWRLSQSHSQQHSSYLSLIPAHTWDCVYFSLI